MDRSAHSLTSGYSSSQLYLFPHLCSPCSRQTGLLTSIFCLCPTVRGIWDVLIMCQTLTNNLLLGHKKMQRYVIDCQRQIAYICIHVFTYVHMHALKSVCTHTHTHILLKIFILKQYNCRLDRFLFSSLKDFV